MAAPESGGSAPPEVTGEGSSPLVIRTRTDSGVRWEAQFHLRPADSQLPWGNLSRLSLRSNSPHPERDGTLEEYDVFVAQTAEGVGAAVHLVRDRVKSWPIHWMRSGATEIRGRTEGRTLVGIQDDEVADLMEAVSRQVRQPST